LGSAVLPAAKAVLLQPCDDLLGFLSCRTSALSAVSVLILDIESDPVDRWDAGDGVDHGTLLTRSRRGATECLLRAVSVGPSARLAFSVYDKTNASELV